MSEPFNAGDPKQVKARETSAKLLREQQENDLVELLKLPQFRRFLWRHICETCSAVGKSAFNPNGSVQSYNLGMQNVGVVLWMEIESVDPALIPQMMSEYLTAQKASKAKAKVEPKEGDNE